MAVEVLSPEQNLARLPRVSFRNLTPQELEDIFGQSVGFAERLLPGEGVLRRALEERTRGLIDSLAERQNAMGQVFSTSGTAQSALARALAGTAAEAELEQARQRANLGAGFFGQGRGELFGSRQAEFGGDLQRSLMASQLAQQQLEAKLAEDLAARERKERKRRGLFSGIGGVLGGVGGFLVGGPLGAAAGANIGSGLGGGLSV
jgi:hypothetical protein